MKDDSRTRDDGDSSRTELEPPRAVAGEAAPLAHGTVLGGRFVVERVLGRGGMGLVVRAHDRVLGEPVAIKLLRPELTAERRWAERLAREVKLARQIRHPNVCRVFDFGEADGHVFLVMELATGGSLRGEIDSGALAARPLADRLADARAIAAGLAAIHDAGIVHRDVTPQNILRMPDGRVVVSDFGLATDASETTTSIHGGTVAYMAPEVARGARATFASDVWSLGVVIHEVVFGARPTWGKRGGAPMRWPREPGTLTADERALFEVCRACTVAEGDRRPSSAAAVVARIDGSPRNVAGRLRKRAAAVLVIAAIAVASTVAIRKTRSKVEHPDTRPSPYAVTVTGHAADWTDIARVIARREGRLHCLVALPGRRTLRLVWAMPPQADDIDVVTGAARRSPLVPIAYRHGCPDLSPDGRRLLFQGYDDRGRATIWLSEKADGSDARPVVASFDPTVGSEPRWLAAGRAFVFDVDAKHAAIFDSDSGRLTMLPDSDRDPTNVFRFVIGDHVVVANSTESPDRADVREFDWPSLRETAHLDVPWFAVTWYVSDAGNRYSAVASIGGYAPVLQVDNATHVAHELGYIRNQVIRNIAEVPGALVFVSQRVVAEGWVETATGGLVQLAIAEPLRDIASCGPKEFIASVLLPDGLTRIARLSPEGAETSRLTDGTADRWPVCMSDGKGWAYVSSGALHVCDLSGCNVLTQGDVFAGIAISPDDQRIAYVALSNRGPHVRWIASSGGPPHEVANTETGCAPAWSSNTNLWVSRRRGGRVVWTEVDTDTGVETGKTVEGGQDCTNGDPDPKSPVPGRARTVVRRTLEVRYLPMAEIGSTKK